MQKEFALTGFLVYFHKKNVSGYFGLAVVMPCHNIDILVTWLDHNRMKRLRDIHFCAKVYHYHINVFFFQWPYFSVYLFGIGVSYYSQMALPALKVKTNGHEILLKVRPISKAHDGSINDVIYWGQPNIYV